MRTKRLGLLVVILAAVSVFGLMQGTWAQTSDDAAQQDRRGFGRGADAGEYSDSDLRMISAVHGYDHGYIDGYEQGRKDAAAKASFEYERQEAYRDADRGLDVRFSRSDFQQGYKSGYEKGYADGFYGKDNALARRYADLGLASGNRVADQRTVDQPPDTPRQPPDTPRQPSTVRSSSGYTRGRMVLVPEGTPIRARIAEALSTKTNRRGDRFSAEVIQPVFVGRDIVIPTGSTVKGSLATLERPGRVSGRAAMNLRFESVVLPDGTEEPIVGTITSLDQREKAKVEGGEGTIKGQGSKGRDAAIIGGAAGVGAAIGAIAGGAKGTAIGGGSGALIGLAGVLATRGKDIELPPGTEVELKLDRPVNLPIAQ